MADPAMVNVRYKDTAARDEVTVLDAFTGSGDQGFKRGEVKRLPAGAWVFRLVRDVSVKTPAGGQAWTDDDRAACEFEIVADAAATGPLPAAADTPSSDTLATPEVK